MERYELRCRSARRVAAVVDQRKDAAEERDGGKEQKQDAVAERSATAVAGSSSILVAHRAALRDGVASAQRKRNCGRQRPKCSPKTSRARKHKRGRPDRHDRDSSTLQACGALVRRHGGLRWIGIEGGAVW